MPELWNAAAFDEGRSVLPFATRRSSHGEVAASAFSPSSIHVELVGFHDSSGRPHGALEPGSELRTPVTQAEVVAKLPTSTTFSLLPGFRYDRR